MPLPAAPRDPSASALPGLEAEVARLRDQQREAEKKFQATSTEIKGLDTQMSGLQSRIREIYRRDTTFRFWMKVTDVVGKVGAGVAVAGMATFSMNGLLGFGMFMGGLAVFAGAYLRQIKARVRNMNITAEAVPLQNTHDRLAQQRAALVAEADALARREESLNQPIQTAQGKLDVLRMARMANGSTRPAGTVEVAQDTVVIGGVAVPRKAGAAGPA